MTGKPSSDGLVQVSGTVGQMAGAKGEQTTRVHFFSHLLVGCTNRSQTDPLPLPSLQRGLHRVGQKNTDMAASSSVCCTSLVTLVSVKTSTSGSITGSDAEQPPPLKDAPVSALPSDFWEAQSKKKQTKNTTVKNRKPAKSKNTHLADHSSTWFICLISNTFIHG